MEKRHLVTCSHQLLVFYQSKYNKCLSNSDYAKTNELLDYLTRFSSAQVALFQKNRLYGLVFQKIVNSITTNQFTEGRYLDGITAILIWLLKGELTSAIAQKEKQQLLSVLRVCTSRDSYRFHNADLQTMILQFCGLKGEEKTSIAWFYREYCMKWLEECLGSSNRKNFSKESMSFFFELLLELAKSNVYRERVATIMAVFPMLMLSDDADSKSAELRSRAKEFIIQLVKEGFGIGVDCYLDT